MGQKRMDDDSDERKPTSTSVTLEQAKAAVTRTYGGSDQMTWMIGAIYQDEAYFAFTVGAREWLVDGDRNFEIIGSWPIFINRETGQDELPEGVVYIMDALDRLDRMALVADYADAARGGRSSLERFIWEPGDFIKVDPSRPIPRRKPLPKPGGQLNPDEWSGGK